ncbi:hypothetical protein ATCC90586_008950 [Pythium insidiosum]|nr:hypothetical protein ATCC90586_008950 [Pythium insidiosum]
MIPMNDAGADAASHDTSVVDVDMDEFRAPSTGLSPRRKARQLQQQQQRQMLSPPSQDDEPFASDADPYDSDGKMAMGRTSEEDLGDDRLRVNGIVVDQDMPSGAKPGWEDVYQIMFQSSTPNGHKMALTLLIMVSVSVTIAVLDSVNSIRNDVGDYFLALEVFFTIGFSLEYALRVLCLRQAHEYMLSVIGLIDMCALVSTYLGLFIPSSRPLIHLAVLRIFRVMRVFRVLRLARFVDASAALSDNIRANKRRIAVFLIALFTMILVIGCAMYLIEGDHHGFSNIPISLYWTVVTITTVGYGDIAPQTVLGRMLATVVMFSGYGIIACPLILNQSGHQDVLTEVIECPRCFRRLHQEDANFCRVCGAALRQPRAKTVKARARERLRLARLRTPTSTTSIGDMASLPSATSSAKSTAHLLTDELDRDRNGHPVSQA